MEITSNTPPMSSSERTAWLRELEYRVVQLGDWIDSEAYPALADGPLKTDPQVRSINETLVHLRRDVREPRPIPVVLVGETGVGKSTLLNALLHTSFLPVGSVGSQTAAFISLSYGSDWRMTCEYVAEEELRQTFVDGAKLDTPELREAREVAEDIRRKLHALLEIKLTDPLPPPEVLAAGPSTELLEYVRAGKRVFQGQNECRRQLRVHGKQRLWPITNIIHVEGPFEVLQSGVVISDLPGAGDLNRARVRQSKSAIERAGQILIAVRARGITQSLFDQLYQNRFTHRLIKDESSIRVVVVGTWLDADLPNPRIAPDRVIDEFDLDPETCTKADIFKANCAKWVEYTRGQLREWLYNSAIEFRPEWSAEERNAFAARVLDRISFVAASAPDWIALDAGEQSLVCASPEDTKVPELRELISGMADEQIAATRTEFVHRITELNDVVYDALARSEQMVGADIEAILRVLEKSADEVKEVQDGYVQQVEDLRYTVLERFQGIRESLGVRIDNAALRMEREAQKRVREQSDGIHFSTIRAAANRGGTFRSSTGRYVNFRDWIAGELTRQVPLAWSDQADTELRKRIEDAQLKLLEVMENFAGDVRKIVYQHSDAPALRRTIESQLTATLRKAEVEVERAGEKVTQLRDSTSTHMQSRIDEAVGESVDAVAERIAMSFGTGFLSRARNFLLQETENLANEAASRCKELADQALNDIEQAVNGFCKIAEREVQQLSSSLPEVLRDAFEQSKLSTPQEQIVRFQHARELRPQIRFEECSTADAPELVGGVTA